MARCACLCLLAPAASCVTTPTPCCCLLLLSLPPLLRCAGFDTSGPAAWTEDFLLRQLDASMTQRNLMPDWSEVVEQEVVEDLTPKYVNGKRVLVNSEIE